MLTDDQEIDQLINNHGNSLAGKIWRGSSFKQRSTNRLGTIDSGFPNFNKALHSNGWPLKTMTELRLSSNGIGELRLLLPALRSLQKKSLQKNIILVNPPYLPFAPSWVKEQIDVRKLTIIQSKNIQDTLWSIEQSLSADCCVAVLGWTGNYNLNTQELRRLQLATENSSTWNILLRDSRCLEQSSVAGLRLHLSPNLSSRLDIHILKQPNGWGGQRCQLSLRPHYENWQKIPAHLLPCKQSSHKQSLNQAPPQEVSNRLSKAKSDTVVLISSISSLKTVH